MTTNLMKTLTCGRCNGSGLHTHGVCFGCRGLGVIPAEINGSGYLHYKKAVDSVIDELGKAEIIIQAVLNVMTTEQKAKVAVQLETSGISPDGMTRFHERRAALSAFGR
jgi:hypothetical protein